MGFEALEPRYAPGAPSKSVTVGARRVGSRQARIEVVLPQNTFAGAKRASVALGNGDDAGWLRVAPAEAGSGYAMITEKGSGKRRRIRIGVLRVKEAHPREPVERRIEAGALYIKLPAWANGAG